MKHLILFETFNNVPSGIKEIDHQQLNTILNIARDEGITIEYDWINEIVNRPIFSIFFNRTEETGDIKFVNGSSERETIENCDLKTFQGTMVDINNRVNNLMDQKYSILVTSASNEFNLNYKENINFEIWLKDIIDKTTGAEIYGMEFYFYGNKHDGT